MFVTDQRVFVELEQSLTEQFFSQMALIRRVEQSLLDLYADGLLYGTVHTSMGQEGCDVGVISALDKERDVIFSNHRAHGQFLAYTNDVEGLIAEIMGKRTGVSRGIGGSQHLHKFNMYTNGIQGGIVANAVGAALGEKLRKSGAVTIVFLGDGTMGQGAVYESFNIASLWSLPVLFVLEDNGIAQSTPARLEHAGDLTTRSASFGIDTHVVDAEDVFSVYSSTLRILDWIRQHQRPYLIYARTARLGPHSKGDDTRSAEEIESQKRKDPLMHLAQKVAPERQREIEAAIEKRIRSAIETAVQADSLDKADWG
jgi:TPP-dependent pyruvate/acetoin dehydrogenase alpha subunit